MCKGKPAQQEAQPPHEQVEYVETEDDSTDSDYEQAAFAICTVVKE